MSEPGAPQVIRLDKVEDLFSLCGKLFGALSAGCIWFRGLPDANMRVLPSLYHRIDPQQEKSLFHRFRFGAEARYSRCPPFDDYGRWLCLMQHYGVPTRLMDWTDSLLIALYFALASEKHVGDAAVWALDPYRLNGEYLKRKTLTTLEDIRIAPQLKAVFGGAENFSNKADEAFALMPYEFDLRLMVQQSRFTFHTSGCPLDGLAGCEGFLLKCVIPAELRSPIMQFVRHMGIDQGFLFPDLTNYGNFLSESAGGKPR